MTRTQHATHIVTRGPENAPELFWRPSRAAPNAVYFNMCPSLHWAKRSACNAKIPFLLARVCCEGTTVRLEPFVQNISQIRGKSGE